MKQTVRKVHINDLPTLIVGLKAALIIAKCLDKKLYKKMVAEVKKTRVELILKKNIYQ